MKNEDVNRRRATVDLIEKSESSEHYRNILIEFRAALKPDASDEDRESLHSPTSEDEKETRRKIQHFLNHYELVSIGILGGSLHEKTYRDWMMSVFVRDWNSASSYIQRERWKLNQSTGKWIYNKRVYVNFEKLALKWSKKCKLQAAKISERTSRHPKVPKGPGDVATPIPLPDESDTPKVNAASTQPTCGTHSTPSPQP